MKSAGPTGWRGVMNRSPRPSDFGLSPLADNADSLAQRPRARVSRIRHGIGGGMRLYDENELAQAAPSRFNDEWMGRCLSLTAPRVVFGIYAAVLVTLLLITHVYLRFQIHDMQMQQHALQAIHRDLDRESAMLDGHRAFLSDPGRLKEFAVMDLAMVENGRSPELTVPPYLVQKYSPELIATARQEQLREIAQLKQGGRKNPFRQIADMALAFARD